MCIVNIIRAAVKMANMDAKFKHMFTHPTFLDNVGVGGCGVFEMFG